MLRGDDGDVGLPLHAVLAVGLGITQTGKNLCYVSELDAVRGCYSGLMNQPTNAPRPAPMAGYESNATLAVEQLRVGGQSSVATVTIPMTPPAAAPTAAPNFAGCRLIQLFLGDDVCP